MFKARLTLNVLKSPIHFVSCKNGLCLKNNFEQISHFVLCDAVI